MLLKKSFKGGAHPPEGKHYSEHKPIETAPLPDTVVIPVQQHIGAPAEPIVKKGDYVKTGQPIAKAVKFVSVPCHASVTGTITAVEKRPHPLGAKVLSVVIKREEEDQWFEDYSKATSIDDLSVDEIKNRIQNAGIAGMGGAAFPTHVKLSPPEGKTIDILIINGVECEPYLTSDHRLMVEKPDEVLKGIQILQKIVNVQKVIIGIEKNKPDAIKILKDKISGLKNISVLPLNVKYPQGAEKQLIKASTGREVPSGGLPMDVGALVHNVGTAFAVYEAVTFNKPLIERIVTVTGEGIKEPKNVKVRIGTSFKYLVDFCNGYTENASKIINGGPMMGIAQKNDDVPVIKGTSGILVLEKKQADLPEEQPCISCARCVDVCPMKLLPSHIATYVEHDLIDDAYKLGLFDCMECGTCSFICPSKRHLVQYIKYGKSQWNKKYRKAD